MVSPQIGPFLLIVFPLCVQNSKCPTPPLFSHPQHRGGEICKCRGQRQACLHLSEWLLPLSPYPPAAPHSKRLACGQGRPGSLPQLLLFFMLLRNKFTSERTLRVNWEPLLFMQDPTPTSCVLVYPLLVTGSSLSWRINLEPTKFSCPMNSSSLIIIRVKNNSDSHLPSCSRRFRVPRPRSHLSHLCNSGGTRYVWQWKGHWVWCQSLSRFWVSLVFIGWAARNISLLCGHSPQSLLVYKGKEVSLLASQHMKQK